MECDTESDDRVTTPLATLSYLNRIFSNPSYGTVFGSGANLTISAEATPVLGTISVDPLVGATGASGNSQFALRLEKEILSSPTQLPTDLTNTNADIGKYWLIVQSDAAGNTISNAAYIWYGAEWRMLKFGTQGPPGPYPVIAPTVTLLPAEDNSNFNNVTGTGSAASPYLYPMELAIPTGPQGPSATLASFPDVQGDTPQVGETLTYSGSNITVDGDSLPIWEPTSAGDTIPAPYTVPESAFSSYIGINLGAVKTIGTFSVPPNPWPWKPVVFGQIAVSGIELSSSPLKIGVEVLLGNPTTGTLVARGFGNSIGGIVTLVPHTSSPGSPTTAMTPSNGVAEVVANHGGTAGTLYVNLVNDGLLEFADFNAANSQLFVMACPMSTEGSIFAVGALRTKVTLSAKSITHGS